MDAQTTFRVINNSAAFIGGNVVSRVLKFITALWIVRSLSGEAYGQFSFIYVYLSFFEILVQFGSNAILTKEVTQKPEAASRILGNALLFRLIFCFLALPVAWTLIRWLGYPVEVRQGVVLASFQLFLTLQAALETLYRVQLKVIYPAVWNLIRNLLNLGFVAAAVFLKPAILSFISAYLASGFLALGGFAFYTRRFIRLDFRPDWALMTRLLSQSAPLLASSYLTLLYYRIDVFMLSKMKSFLDVGYYSVAVRLTEALDIIATSLLVSLFPLLSRYIQEDRASFERTVSRGFKLLLLLGLPIALGGSLVASELTVFLFGAAYAPSAMTLRILLWYNLFAFLGCLLANLLIAGGRQIVDAWISLAQVIANIGLNLILIPHYSYNGAAIAPVIGAFVGVAFTFFYAVRDPRILLPIPWREAGQAALVNAVFLAIFAGWMALADLPVLLDILLGIAIYGCLLLAFRILRWQQAVSYLSLWRKNG